MFEYREPKAKKGSSEKKTNSVCVISLDMSRYPQPKANGFLEAGVVFLLRSYI